MHETPTVKSGNALATNLLEFLGENTIESVFFVNYIHVLSYDHQKCWQQCVNITGARRNSSNYLKTTHSLDAAVKSSRSQHCSRSKTKFIIITAFVITLRAKLSSAVYCNRSCLFVCLWVCGFVCGSVATITGNCVHLSSPNWVCR